MPESSEVAQSAVDKQIKLHDSWKEPLLPVLTGEKMAALRSFLQAELAAGKTVYPPMPQVFAALDATPLDRVKVVILGQDPYPGANQAHGLSFSVRPGVPVPRSLQNIYQELKQEFGIAPPKHGYLMPWAEQGVLLLNAVLTVEANQINAHKGKGWEHFTDAVIDLVNERAQHVVFMLWGKQAQEKGARVDAKKHLVLKSPHPSPMSASQGFFGCGHFSKANDYLKLHNRSPVDWQLPYQIDLK
jgi:uracil-DNA glycosylase